MKTARLLSLMLAFGLAATVLTAASPGKNVEATVSFATTDLSVANETSRKCVKLGKAGYIHKIVCNCHTGTVDITILDADVSVFPTATATTQAAPLAIATGCSSSVIIDVSSTYISATPNFGEVCIQVTAVGGEAAVNCKLRASARAHGDP